MNFAIDNSKSGAWSRDGKHFTLKVEELSCSSACEGGDAWRCNTIESEVRTAELYASVVARLETALVAPERWRWRRYSRDLANLAIKTFTRPAPAP